MSQRNQTESGRAKHKSGRVRQGLGNVGVSEKNVLDSGRISGQRRITGSDTADYAIEITCLSDLNRFTEIQVGR